ncbi:hypothetical protein CC2G_013580 [Coprinopsis cinerea AmutBmut pab1-1]|nr:hypothetical protein CC2G_013580 [Coprinopsis cinerea AmutBmut pab1-1]
MGSLPSESDRRVAVDRQSGTVASSSCHVPKAATTSYGKVKSPEIALKSSPTRQIAMTLTGILSGTLTCKSFYKLSKLKILWIYAVRDSYRRHGLQNFVSQFSLEKMSLEELERLALSPSRFLDWMRRAHSKFIPTFEDVTVVRPPPPCAIEFDCTFMVPGGRFLVTTSREKAYFNEGETVACLWDLGFGQSHPIKSSPVAHVLLPKEFRTTDIGATASGHIVLCGVDDAVERQCTIYTVDIRNPLQGFRLEAQLDNTPAPEEHELLYFNVSGDYIWMTRNRAENDIKVVEIFVWNYRCDGAALLNPGMISIDWVSIFGDTLVTVHRNIQSSVMEIRTFDIPLRRRADFSDLNDLPSVRVTDKSTLRQEFEYGFEEANEARVLFSPNWAVSDEGTLPAVVVMDGEGDGAEVYEEEDEELSWGLEVYAIGVDTVEGGGDLNMEEGSTAQTPSTTSRRIGSTGSYTGRGRYTVESEVDGPFPSGSNIAYADNHLFFFSGQAIQELPEIPAAAVTAVPISRRGLDAGEPLACYTFYTDLGKHCDLPIISICAICPLTGRMAVIRADHENEEGEIRIIDLLDSAIPDDSEE